MCGCLNSNSSQVSNGRGAAPAAGTIDIKNTASAGFFDTHPSNANRIKKAVEFNCPPKFIAADAGRSTGAWE